MLVHHFSFQNGETKNLTISPLTFNSIQFLFNVDLIFLSSYDNSSSIARYFYFIIYLFIN